MKNKETELVNRVANSRLKVINLEKYFPEIDIMEFDLKDYLFMELILKEKEFRSSLKEVDWSVYTGKAVALNCSTDAIIPTWAFMLAATYLEPVADRIFMGTKNELIEKEYRNKLESLDYSQYKDEMIVIKGCSQKPVPTSAYVELTIKLRPLAKSIMYGEACSTVPIYKKPKINLS